jgi:hypothetical protein
MRRVDILKMQLLNSRGRFFTAEWKLLIGDTIRANFKVTSVEGVGKDSVTCRVFVPAYKRHFVLTFFVNAKGDCTYIASDRSKFQMSGQRALNF